MSFLGPPYIEMQTNANCLSSLSAIWDTCGRITSNASAVNVYFHRRCRNEGLRLSLWLSSSAIVWTASRIQRVPHHKRLQPTARNPRERLRWDARAAAFSSTCWPFNDSIWALATVPIMQLHDCHNNATVKCRFEWCGSISALYSAVGYGRRLRFACADSLQLLCFGNLWPISLMGCTICDQFPYWTSLVHEGTSRTGLLASPVLRRCLQTAGFFCIDRPCWAHRLCFSSWPGWFGCRAGSGIWQGPDARTAGTARTSLFLYVRKQASRIAMAQSHSFTLTRRRASSSLSWLSSLIGNWHLTHTHTQCMWYLYHHTLSILVDWCGWAGERRCRRQGRWFEQQTTLVWALRGAGEAKFGAMWNCWLWEAW